MAVFSCTGEKKDFKIKSTFFKIAFQGLLRGRGNFEHGGEQLRRAMILSDSKKWTA
jgi:hypothetical protein